MRGYAFDTWPACFEWGCKVSNAGQILDAILVLNSSHIVDVTPMDQHHQALLKAVIETLSPDQLLNGEH